MPSFLSGRYSAVKVRKKLYVTKATTVDALPQIIEFYRDRGYEFRAIDRESFVCHHGVNN